MELTGLVASGSSYLERSSRPLADQTCVYNITTHIAESLVVASITECKAPHKLPLGYIYEGLEDMELEEAICCKDIDPPQQHARWFSTVAINQAFSYFVYGKHGARVRLCLHRRSIRLPTDIRRP
ncbi:hypothetical protein COCSADRAFT_28210 [Bipolaris sorokiniana ND90Pr]|uniref:Uncharacterized protein n=1 Tax=Cochliobolus sativus (strain ND90Pr / ATCC 201652) TaxID=665912 RepID=M2R6H3_COCSN|nr:uncharacterized protein COCSADRAFT_28210 [Bipolaris sorokiniana ND90Pr]EMD62744.1 hypothetical protein COCSADRAFT_28210 [Bipolaris sorokiniana ND90Pr]